MAKWQKGQSGNPNGRPKGTRNKSTQAVIDKILEAATVLEDEGKGIVACAKQDPKWFLEKILPRILPKNIEIEQVGDFIVKLISYKDGDPGTDDTA